jgi:hypothetical protein
MPHRKICGQPPKKSRWKFAWATKSIFCLKFSQLLPAFGTFRSIPLYRIERFIAAVQQIHRSTAPRVAKFSPATVAPDPV